MTAEAAAAAYSQQAHFSTPGTSETESMTLPALSSSNLAAAAGTVYSHSTSDAAAASLPPMGESLRVEVEQRIRDHALSQVSFFLKK